VSLFSPYFSHNHFTTMATLSLAALISKVDPLTDKNWYKWKNQIMMIFRMDGSAALIAGTERRPNDQTEAATWDRRDSTTLGLIWASTHADFLFLIEEETSSSACFAKLKTKFESTSFARRVELCKQFYSVEHDPSKPIDIYIQQILDVKGQLVTIDHKIEDVEVKDVILMNLHSSYETVKLSLLMQPTEPSLDVIRSFLNSSSSIIDAPFAVKSESTDTGLATKFKRSGSNKRVGHGHVSGSSDSHGTSVGGIEDNKGYRWGDVMSDNCHRCGREGNIAALCVADMPPDIKSRILGKSPTKNERSSYIRNSVFGHSHSPPSPFHRVSFHKYSRSPSPAKSYYDSS
jgi:hypothetical protein